MVQRLTKFQGVVAAVKPRITLHRSFDHVWHSYHGYVLVLEDGPRVAVGPAAHEKHRFRIGDLVGGEGVPVPDSQADWAELYKVRRLVLASRGHETADRPADPDGGMGHPPGSARPSLRNWNSGSSSRTGRLLVDVRSPFPDARRWPKLRPPSDSTRR